MIELLLVTPLPETEIVRGHWRGLLRMFLVPVLVLTTVHVSGTALSQLSMRQIYSRAAMPPTTSSITTTNQSGTTTTVVIPPSRRGVYVTRTSVGPAPSLGRFKMPGDLGQWLTVVFAATAAALSTAGNLIALCWFGMWMGMTSKSANLATLKTLLFVQIVPALVIYFASSMLVMAVMMPFFFKIGRGTTPNLSGMMWWPLLSTGVVSLLAIAKDIGFIVWSRKRLFGSFREQSAQSLGQPRLADPPPLPFVQAPPILAN